MGFFQHLVLAALMLLALAPVAQAKTGHVNVPSSPVVAAGPGVAEHAPEHKAQAGHEEASAGLPQMDVTRFAGQIFWLVVTFTLTYLLMRYVALPQVQGVVEGREKRISDDIVVAKAKNENAKKLMAEYESRLKTARDESQTAVKAAAQATSKKMADALQAQTQKLNATLQTAESRIANQKSEASAALANETVGVVTALVKNIAGYTPEASAVEAALKQARNV